MNLEGYKGRVALITGGAQGIGREIAERMRDLGAKVAVGDLREPAISGCLNITLDVTSEDSVRAAIEQVSQTLGNIDILVLNAGIFIIEPLEETTLSSWERTISVNLTGAFLVSRSVLPQMRASGYGRVLIIGSSAGITGGSKSMAAYAASKAGVMALAKSIASEYASFGVTSNALAPTLIETGMVKGIAELASRIPVGRLGKPADVADLAAFLCSEHAGYITGAVVDINGGFLIH
jgi:NAD(P)-dependent dehydrogenase (short-subunit alcohol dehydrogenase family)